MMSTGTAAAVFGAAFLNRPNTLFQAQGRDHPLAQTAIRESCDWFMDDLPLATVAARVLFAIRIKRRVFGRDPDAKVADSDSLDADMVPVTTSDDVGQSRGKAFPT
jgi:hypothetical protein